MVVRLGLLVVVHPQLGASASCPNHQEVAYQAVPPNQVGMGMAVHLAQENRMVSPVLVWQ